MANPTMKTILGETFSLLLFLLWVAILGIWACHELLDASALKLHMTFRQVDHDVDLKVSRYCKWIGSTMTAFLGEIMKSHGILSVQDRQEKTQSVVDGEGSRGLLSRKTFDEQAHVPHRNATSSMPIHQPAAKPISTTPNETVDSPSQMGCPESSAAIGFTPAKLPRSDTAIETTPLRSLLEESNKPCSATLCQSPALPRSDTAVENFHSFFLLDTPLSSPPQPTPMELTPTVSELKQKNNSPPGAGLFSPIRNPFRPLSSSRCKGN
ncbi:hypothetical protein ACA910_003907 [Epithemia clementina (nom. ined.)]